MSFDGLAENRRNLSLNSLPAWLMVGLAVVIAVILATQPWLMRFEINQAKIESLQRLGAHKTSLLATIDKHLYLPRVLAADPRIVNSLTSLAEKPAEGQTQDYGLLRQINQKAESNEIFLMDREGQAHYSSNFGSETSFVGNNYGFRPYFIDAMAGDAGFYFAVGATSGIPGLFLSAPVRADGGEILGVVVIKIDLGKLEQSWANSDDPIWVTDENGIIFLASRSERHYHSFSPISESLESKLANTRQYGRGPVKALRRVTQWQSADWSTFDLEGSGPQVMFGSPIDGYPWRMHLRVPLEQIRAQVLLKQALIVALYAAIAVGSMLYRERRRRTEAQESLVQLTAERESHQRAIIQNTDVGLLNLDARLRPIFLNEQAQTLFRLKEADGPYGPADLVDPWDSSAAGKGPRRAEGVRTDGTRFPVIYTLNPISVGENEEFILTVQDVTELTAAQQALQKINKALEHRVRERTRDLEQAQAALAQNQKLAALGRMSAAIAHEINQPITALSNFVANSQVLLTRDQPEKVNDNLVKIETLLQRLSKLSRQLRIFSGKRNSGSAFVSIKAPIDYALELLGSRFESEQIQCRIYVPKDYEVWANAMVLEQIFVNLISNAIDALAGQPNARISIRVEALENPPVRVSVGIEDNGHGMSDEQLAQVFEPFFTTKPMGQGLGLGLAISYSLACDIGAELSVSSETGNGTRFTLILPITNTTGAELS